MRFEPPSRSEALRSQGELLSRDAENRPTTPAGESIDGADSLRAGLPATAAVTLAVTLPGGNCVTLARQQVAENGHFPVRRACPEPVEG